MFFKFSPIKCHVIRCWAFKEQTIVLTISKSFKQCTLICYFGLDIR